MPDTSYHRGWVPCAYSLPSLQTQLTRSIRSILLSSIQGTRVQLSTNQVTGFARNAIILTGEGEKSARRAIHVGEVSASLFALF